MFTPNLFFILPYLLFGLMLLFVALGVPVAFSLILSSIAMILLDPRLGIWIVFQRMFNGMNSFVLLAVPLFLLAGNLMNNANITDRLIVFSRNLIGHLKGSLAHVNVVVSMFFAGVSGSSTADSAGIGSVLIPAMIKEGYPKAFTVAVTAASSVMGIIIPPSINMIVWGALTNTSIVSMFLGGFIPGVLIAVSQIGLNFVFVKKYHVPTYPRASFKKLLSSSRDGLLALVVPVIIIGGLIGGIFSPTEAAVTAVVYSLILGILIYRDLSMGAIIKSATETVKLSSLSLFSLVAASIFGYLISFYQVPNLLLHNIGTGSPTTMLILMVIVMLIIGTFMDALPAMAILAPLFMPLIHKAGINPVHFGVISVMALGLGLITPPYGLCLMIAAKIGEISIIRAFGVTAAYLAIMIVLVILIIFIPDIVLIVPKLIAPQFIQ